MKGNNVIKLSVKRYRSILRSSNQIVGGTIVATACLVAIPSTYAFEFDSGNPDFTARWDNTIKYTGAFRVKGRSNKLISSLNQDDGDRSFDKGMISNRADLLSELDLTYKAVGMRVTGAAWYDDIYNRSNDNNSATTYNARSVSHNEFTDATRNLHGRKGEILDAFVYAKGSFGEESNGIVRVGKHTVLYGESLFFGNNGIAGGQSPIDVVKAQSVPNTPFKEIILPVGQVSVQFQLQTNLSIGGYYQYDWEKTRIPGVGSYFSGSDTLDVGGERLRAAGPAAFFRGNDLIARDSGQGGIQVRYTAEPLQTDFGLYAIRYHDKTAKVYILPGRRVTPAIGKIGEYLLAYPEGIAAYGLSATTNVGLANVAGEISIRRNTPLVSPGQTIAPGATADNNDHPFYAVGNSAHAQVSVIYPLPRTAYWHGGTVTGEVAWNTRTSITKNPKALDPLATKDASAMRIVFSPTYLQVLPELDIAIPIGLGYGISGRSSVVGNFAPHHAGDISFGMQGVFRQVWRFGLNYTHYFGAENNVLNAANTFTFGQSLKDRDFVSLSLQRTF